MPTTKLGQLSTWLLAACAVIFAVAVAVSLIAGNSFDNSAFDLYRAVVGIGFLLTGAGSVIAGLTATIRDHERGVLVFIAIALGLIAVAFALGDVVFG